MSKIKETYLESARAIANASGRRGLTGRTFEKRAPAGANSKLELARAVG